MFRILSVTSAVAMALLLTSTDFVQAQRADGGGFEASDRGQGGGFGGGRDDGFGLTNGDDNRSSAVIHDSDQQLDIWVQRCNDAGGGMSTDDTGNYTCTGSDGAEIEDY